jgi:outer membrane protein assembly factor BamB
VFNVSINSTKVLSNFDVYATAGARFKAVAESFNATASAGGTIAIALTAVTDNAAVNGIEITSGGGPTPTPTRASFNDYATFGYDNGREVFNPNSTAIAPASIVKLHLAWQASVGDYNTQTQPVLATEIPGHAGVLFVGGGSGKVYGYDALTGTLLWKRSTGQFVYTACGGTRYSGIGGSAAYDAASRSLYVVGKSNPSTDAYVKNTLYRLDGATGTILGQVNFAPAGTGVTFPIEGKRDPVSFTLTS